MIAYDGRVPRPVDIVIEFLREQESRGITHVDLDEPARSFLNSLSKRKSEAPTTRNTATPAAPVPVAAPTPLAPIQTTGNSKAERLADLRRQLQDFPRARGLAQLRDTLVFSQGNPDARLVFIGESPSHHDEQQGHPFAGPVGEKFDAILKAMNLSRAEVYLTHLVKFRPATKNQTTNNRAPSAEEIAAFVPVLAHEISIIAPQVIVTLGSVPTMTLCASDQAPESLRGAWHEWHGIALRASDSPSFLLSAANAKKRKFWEDMLAAMEKLALPISEKQRGYFVEK
jgi:uracil-DNA glycosylase family 4